MSRTTKKRFALSLTELVDLYLMRCQQEGKSRGTVVNYRWTLTHFLKNLQQQGVPARADAVRPEHIYRYMASNSLLAPATRHRYFREVRCFFGWLVEVEFLDRSPFRHLRNVRLPVKIVQPFMPEDVQRLLAGCWPNDVGARDRAIIVMLLDTGLRASELAGLNLDDIDITDMRLRVLHGKGNKQRIVPFSTACRDMLLRYLEERGDDPGPLFYGGRRGRGVLVPGVRLEANGLKHMMRRLSTKTGVVNVHPHRFRHTFATWAIQQGAREIDVQLLLGHSTSEMVRRYTASYNAEQAARRHASFSPLLLMSRDPQIS